MAPANADLLSAMAYAEESLGRWESAVERHRQAERLDPRSVLTKFRLWLRRSCVCAVTPKPGKPGPGPRAGALGSRADPEQGHGVSEPGRPRRRAGRPPSRAGVEPTAVVAYMAIYFDLVWVLDEEQRELLMRMTPSAFDDDRGTWGLCLAQACALKGDPEKTRAYAEEARKGFEEQLRALPRIRNVTSFSASRWRIWAARKKRSGRARAVVAPAGVEGCVQRSLLPARARSDLHARRRAGEGARSARAAAEDPVLPLARLAQDRPQLRSAPEKPAIPAARRRRVRKVVRPPRFERGTFSSGGENGRSHGSPRTAQSFQSMARLHCLGSSPLSARHG